MAGTATGVAAAGMARVRVDPVAETIPSAFTAASESVAVANAGLGIAGAEMEQVG